MSRIAVLGNAAGGKSTLSRRLATARGLERFEIDAQYWQKGWSHTPAAAFHSWHAEAISKQSWIIDGGGDTASIEQRLERATEVILIDLPVWIHFLHAAQRQIEWAQGTLTHPPGIGQDMPPTDRLFEMIWENDQTWMPELRRLCDAQKALGKTVVRLSSVQEIDDYS